MNFSLYKIHRQIAILAVLPVIVWTLSGFMHPIMSNFFKPKQAKKDFLVKNIDFSRIKIGLDSLTKIHHIEKVKNVRFIQFDNKVFYQIKLPKNPILQYFDVENGKILENGDKLYAEHLARYFVGEANTKIKDLKLIEKFEGEYDEVYRLLPVWKVQFAQKDNQRAYIDTELSRLAILQDDYRHAFQNVFKALHNFEIFAFLGDFLKSVAVIALMILCFAGAMSGMLVYGFFWKKFNPNVPKHRILHRNLGILMSVTMLGFAFSGGFHIYQKINKKDFSIFQHEPVLFASELPNLPKMQEIIQKYNPKNTIGNIYFAKMVLDKKETLLLNLVHYEINNSKKPFPIHTDFVLVNDTSNQCIKGGCMGYAEYLAKEFQTQNQLMFGDCCENPSIQTSKVGINGKEESNAENDLLKIKNLVYINEFKGEYGFINKRLPVIRVNFEGKENRRYYIEHTTGQLVTEVTDTKALEGFSFAYLHKFHFLDSIGKINRDLILMFFALGNMLLAGIGLFMWVKRWRKINKKYFFQKEKNA